MGAILLRRRIERPGTAGGERVTIARVCKGCKERYPACWGSCEKYIKARAEYDAAMADYKRKSALTAAAKDLQFNSIERQRRRRKR